MSLALGLLIIVAAAAFVAAPFIRGESAAESPAPASRGQLERQKLDAYAAIKEAEFDYRMGKLSDADFTVLSDKYGAQALAAIAALESTTVGGQKTRPIAEARPSELRRPTRIKFCPMCGHTVPPRANFCPACGRSLKEAVA